MLRRWLTTSWLMHVEGKIEQLAVVNMQMKVLCGVFILCTYDQCWHLRGMYCFHLVSMWNLFRQCVHLKCQNKAVLCTLKTTKSPSFEPQHLLWKPENTCKFSVVLCFVDPNVFDELNAMVWISALRFWMSFVMSVGEICWYVNI